MRLRVAGQQLAVTQYLTLALYGLVLSQHDTTATGHSKAADTACLEAQLGLVDSGVP